MQYLKTAQEVDLSGEKDRLESQLDRRDVKDKGNVRREISKITRVLETQRAPEVQGHELDKVAREEKELREEIVPNLLSGEEMRKSPPGAVGRELAFQKRFKGKILRWKNLRRMLFRGSDDPDVANLEQYRPHTRPGDPSMVGAHIAGTVVSFPSEQFQANYDAIDWKAKAEALERRLEALEHAEPPSKKKMSAETRARLSEEGKRRWAARKAAEAAADAQSA